MLIIVIIRLAIEFKSVRLHKYYKQLGELVCCGIEESYINILLTS